jgi:peptidoglycan/LPS O-acetylase OafA/YrhL
MMQRSILLDMLRIFAISLVFVAHIAQVLGSNAGEFFGIKNIYYVSLGGVGVSVFLVLSGVLAGLGGYVVQAGYTSYIIKKGLRLYPLYWISVPLSMIGYVLGSVLIKGEMPPLLPNGLVGDLLGSVSGFYSWAGLWGGPYNSPSWFIGLIMTLYALFPPLYLALKRWSHWLLCGLLCVSLASRYYVGQYGLPWSDPTWWMDVQGWAYRQYGFMPGRPGDWFVLCRIFEFALGIYLALILPHRIWFIGPNWHWLNKSIYKLSDVCFALFLCHYPFLFILTYLHDLGVELPLCILIFLALIFALSYGMTRLDQKVPRRKILGYLPDGDRVA